MLAPVLDFDMYEHAGTKAAGFPRLCKVVTKREVRIGNIHAACRLHLKSRHERLEPEGIQDIHDRERNFLTPDWKLEKTLLSAYNTDGLKQGDEQNGSDQIMLSLLVSFGNTLISEEACKECRCCR